MESEKEEEDSSEEEMESRVSRPEVASGSDLAAELDAPILTKAQSRELRRLKKADHSWLSDLLDS